VHSQGVKAANLGRTHLEAPSIKPEQVEERDKAEHKNLRTHIELMQTQFSSPTSRDQDMVQSPKSQRVKEINTMQITEIQTKIPAESISSFLLNKKPKKDVCSKSSQTR